MKAFPVSFSTPDVDGKMMQHCQFGMDLRDYFAAAALPAVMADPDTQKTSKLLKQDFGVCVAVIAYRIADEMMEARNESL